MIQAMRVGFLLGFSLPALAAPYYDVDVRAHRIHFHAHVPQGLFPIEGTDDVNSLASYGNSLTHEALLISALPKEAGREIPITAVTNRGFVLDPRTKSLPAIAGANSFLFARTEAVLGEPKYLFYAILSGREENFELQLFTDSPQVIDQAQDILQNFQVISEPRTPVEIANLIGATLTGGLVLFLLICAFLRSRGATPSPRAQVS